MKFSKWNDYCCERKMGNTQQASWLHDCRHADWIYDHTEISSLHQNTSKLCTYYESEHVVWWPSSSWHNTGQSYSGYKHSFTGVVLQSCTLGIYRALFRHGNSTLAGFLTSSMGSRKGQQDFELAKLCSEIISKSVDAFTLCKLLTIGVQMISMGSWEQFFFFFFV